MSYKRRLVIFFSILVLLAIALATFFVMDTQKRFKNIETDNFIPQEASEIFEAR